MKYVSIDIETTGLDPDKHQMIEFGAVLEDTENQLPIDELPKLRVLIVHEDYTSGPYCIKLHSKLFEELGNYTKVALPRRIDCSTWVTRSNEHGLAYIFNKWLDENGMKVKFGDKARKTIVAGKNFNGFDALFLKSYMNYRVQFHHRVIDPAALFTRLSDAEPPNLNECAKRAGVEFKGTGYHSAVSDATMVVELLRKGWK